MPSMARLGFLSALVILCALPCARMSGEPFRMISPGDPLLEDVRFLSREAGKSILSMTPPLSRDEVRLMVGRLAGSIRSPAGTEALDRIEAALSRRPPLTNGQFAFSVRPRAALQGRYRTDDRIPWSQSDAERPSLLDLPLEFFFSDSVYASATLSVRSDPWFSSEEGTRWGTNVPYQAERLDFNMPLRSFLSLGKSFWNVQIGRDRVSFGTGTTGNLGVSDTPDYYDFARLSLFSSQFKYSLLLAQLPLDTEDLLAPGNVPPQGALSRTTQRYLYLHRFDLRFFDRLSVGIAEGLLVGNSPPELRFLNPMALFHSHFAWRDYPSWGPTGDMAGSLITVDLDWAAMPSLAIYAQVAMNQFATPYELERWPEDNSPNGMGWLGGVEYAASLDSWRTSVSFEAVYTDPYLYTLSTPFSSFIWMRRLSELTQKDLRYAWIGHPEGRDTVLYALGAKALKGTLHAAANLSLAYKGEHGISWDWSKGAAALAQRTPSGTAEQRLRGSVDLRWQVLPFFALSSYFAATVIHNADHVESLTRMGVEIALAAHLTL